MIAGIFDAVKFVYDKIQKEVRLYREERFTQLIDLYNAQNVREEGASECEYIFNINNVEDVDYLFNDYKGGEGHCHYKEPRVAQLALMVVNRNSDYFTLCEEDAYFLHEEEIIVKIENNAYKMAQFLFKHPEDFPELWEDYVTKYLDKPK